MSLRRATYKLNPLVILLKLSGYAVIASTLNSKSISIVRVLFMRLDRKIIKNCLLVLEHYKIPNHWNKLAFDSLCLPK